MIVTFCGHSDFIRNDEYERRLLAFFEEKIGNDAVDFYLGGYGAFDSFAYSCAKKYKATHPRASLVFITPYIIVEYQERLKEIEKMYDAVIYPELENIPLRFAIVHRNRFMVQKSDIVVAYVGRRYGGAYKTYKYAVGKGKEIFNLFDTDCVTAVK